MLVLFFAIFPFIYTANDYPYIMHLMIASFFYAILASSWSMLSAATGSSPVVGSS